MRTIHLFYNHNMVTLTEEENQILLLLRCLSPGERAALLRLLEATLERQSR